MVKEQKEIPEVKQEKTNTLISITNKIKAETLEIKAKAKKLDAEAEKVNTERGKVNTEREILLKKSEAESQRSESSSTVWNMLMLTSIMTATFGNGDSISPKRLFSEDDLIEYRAKMLELLKRI